MSFQAKGLSCEKLMRFFDKAYVYLQANYNIMKKIVRFEVIVKQNIYKLKSKSKY